MPGHCGPPIRWRVNQEIGRRSEVAGIHHPNDKALIRLGRMLLVEQTDEWLVERRYLSEVSIRQVLTTPDAPGPNVSGAGEGKEVIELQAA